MFKTDLILKASDPGKWEVSAPLIWVDKERSIIVPSGFVTDLASIPKIVRPFIDRNGKTRRPAIIHDYLYQTAIHSRIKRKDADLIFLSAMKSEGIGLMRYAIYQAVRSFGWMFFSGKS